MLKGVIFGIDNVLFEEGSIDLELIGEIEKLIRFLHSQEITPVVLANRIWKYKEISIDEFLQPYWGDIRWFFANRRDCPLKPKTKATEFVLEKMGWGANEVIYVGSTKDDMRTAVNGKLLFLNVTWYNQNTEYGFQFDSPLDIARFIDTFCLRDHLWHYSISDSEIEYYALAPFSTYFTEYKKYSADARRTAKSKVGFGHPNFWTRYLLSTIYLSGMYTRVNYVTAYPGHTQGSGNEVMADQLSIFAKCFRGKYLPDLIVRHTEATKSQTARIEGVHVDHLNQLNTIKLSKLPHYDDNKQYKNCPLNRDKTVLVVDDFCTRGYSLDAARLYLEQTGVNVICMSWLKTINRPFTLILDKPEFDPFEENHFDESFRVREYPYQKHIVDEQAPEELTRRLNTYINWQWPQ